MKENKIPSAEQFLKSKGLGGYQQFDGVLQEFAKLHVKAALEAALDSIPCLGSSTDIAIYEDVEKEVLSAYPEELIK